jgi:hypothetical protein
MPSYNLITHHGISQLEIPNPKLQIPNKYRIPIPNDPLTLSLSPWGRGKLEFRSLEFIYDLVLALHHIRYRA